MLIQSDLKTTTVHAPLPRSQTRGLMYVDRQMVEDIERHAPGFFPLEYPGVALNDLSPLWPFSWFRQEMFRGAKLYVANLAKQGLSLISQEGGLRVYGPRLIPNWKAAQAGLAVGARRVQVQDGAAGAPGTLEHLPTDDDAIYGFFIDGQFLARTHLVEAAQLAPVTPPALSREEKQAIHRHLFPHRRVA